VTAAEAGTSVKTVTLTATDATSGVAKIEYQLDDDTAWTTYTTPLSFDEAGTYVVRYRATDEAGNTGAGELEVVVPPDPTVTISTAPAAANGLNNWFTSPVTVTLTGAGGDGDLTVEYRIGAGPWTAYTAPFQVANDGVSVVQARATDEADTTSEVATTTIKVDRTTPTVSITGIADGAELDVAAVSTAVVTTADATSGVAERVIRLNGVVVGSPVSIDALSLLTGTHRLEITVKDGAGNQLTRTVTFEVVATYAGGKRLVKRLDDENKVSAKLGKQLKKELRAAKRAAKRGDESQARSALKRFKALASSVKDKEAKIALKHLARQLKAQL
jgi:hypothetical protein